jgi:N-acyl-D-amino-acid deacylase
MEAAMRFDCIIRNGRIIDGTGSRAPFRADVGVVGDRISALGDLCGAETNFTVNADGKVVVPGFIDPHVHSELALLGGRDQLAGIYQGITTNLLSPDGFGWAPLDPDLAQDMWRYTRFGYGDVSIPLGLSTVKAYLDLFRAHIPANVYPQVPYGAVRLRAMGWAQRLANQQELNRMQDTVVEWMEEGSGALSAGLDYQPCIHASTEELVALARVVSSRGGIYAAHIRKQTLGVTGAWQETLEVSRRASIPVHISHERVDRETSRLLEIVGREEIDLTFDSYLYPAGMTHLAIMLPPEIQAGDLQDMLCRMRTPEARRVSLPYLASKLRDSGDPIVAYTGSGRYTGLTLSQAAEAASKPREEFAYDLILDEEGVETFTIPWQGPDRERDDIIRATAVHPRLMIASDGIYNVPHPHPRAYGCFARVLRLFVRETGLLSLEQAVHKMSGLTAERFGLTDRGRIAEGLAADLVVLAPDQIADRSTWAEPLQLAVGVDSVLVNGEPVLSAGLPTGRLPGRVLGRHS